MPESLRLKENYRLAGCCAPVLGDEIIGFLKQDSPVISIHRLGCRETAKVSRDRLISLTWDEVTDRNIEFDISSSPTYRALDDIDFVILRHHKKMGNDYAAVVAKSTGIPRATVFGRHKKLRDLGLLQRMQPVMIQYRKGIVKGKWIKHRNHTYYELTPGGLVITEYHERKSSPKGAS
jgi:hypothetical protein